MSKENSKLRVRILKDSMKVELKGDDINKSVITALVPFSEDEISKIIKKEYDRLFIGTGQEEQSKITAREILKLFKGSEKAKEGGCMSKENSKLTNRIRVKGNLIQIVSGVDEYQTAEIELDFGEDEIGFKIFRCYHNALSEKECRDMWTAKHCQGTRKNQSSDFAKEILKLLTDNKGSEEVKDSEGCKNYEEN